LICLLDLNNLPITLRSRGVHRQLAHRHLKFQRLLRKWQTTLEDIFLPHTVYCCSVDYISQSNVATCLGSFSDGFITNFLYGVGRCKVN